MNFFVQNNHFGAFISSLLIKIATISAITIIVLTFAYFLSGPVFSPRSGTQTPLIQVLQKILILLLIVLAGICMAKFKAFFSDDFKWLSGISILLFITLLLATTLFISWGRSAYPIHGQVWPILIKLFALIGVGFLIVFVITTLAEFFGQRILPHVIGTPTKDTSLFFFGPSVLIPLIIAMISLFTTIILVYTIWDAIIDANILSSSIWLFPSPLAILSALLLIVIGSSWYKYYVKIAEKRDDQNKYIIEESKLESKGDPSTRAQYVRLAEYFLGTHEWNLPTFHPIVDDPHSLGLTFPGFIIGLEKAGQNLIGINKEEQNLRNPKVEKDARQHGSRRLLGDRKRSFISHIAEFTAENATSSTSTDCDIHHEGFGPCFHFNLYGSQKDPLSCAKMGTPAWHNPLIAYNSGFSALDHLGEVLNAEALQANPSQPYTHIMVMCMGWNTDQQESIRNYNSLMGYLKEAKNRTDPSQPFNPLFIGLTWPSQWANFLPASYPTKADDADEVGMIWGSYLLHNTLAKLKNNLADAKRPIKVVLVGHSFGTRVLTRAMSSNPNWINHYSNNPDSLNPLPETMLPKEPTVDLFIGLQGAFSIDRFVNRGPLTGGGLENAPYQELIKSKTRFVFTWSTEDKANPIAAFTTAANHIGGNYGADLASDHPEVFTMVKYQGPDLLEKISIAHKPKKKVPETSEVFTDSGWAEGTWDEETPHIRMVNMSTVVKDTPYGKGGKAHSDIYKYQIGHFLWKTILALEDSKQSSL